MTLPCIVFDKSRTAMLRSVPLLGACPTLPFAAVERSMWDRLPGCLIKSITRAISFMNSTIASRRVLRLLQCSVAAGLILLLLAIAPFAVAQDVHHELAAADTDGHEHSDTDICQWVQHHTAGSLDVDVSPLSVCDLVRNQDPPVESVLLSVDLSVVGPSRAPPCS